jgi:hypothetical protein
MDRRSRRAAWRVSSPRECVCPSTYQMLVYVYICDGCWWWWRPSGAAGWLSLVHDAFSCVCVSLHRIKKHAHKTNRTNKRGSLSHFSSATEPSLGTSFSSCPSAQHIRDPLTQFCVFLSFASIAPGLFTPHWLFSLYFRIDGATLPYLLMRLLLSCWFHLFSFWLWLAEFIWFFKFKFETIN